MPFHRHSGILLHPTSLPGSHGSGDLGPGAYHFVDWLAIAKQSIWQVLPLGGIGPGNSPYMSPSAFAGNELLIDLACLKEASWLRADDLVNAPESDLRRIDFPEMISFRISRLRRAAERFFADPRREAHAAFSAFCAGAADWLDDYALFMALDKAYGSHDRLWQDWPADLVRRKPKALREAAKSLASECNFRKFCQ